MQHQDFHQIQKFKNQKSSWLFIFQSVKKLYYTIFRFAHLYHKDKSEECKGKRTKTH